MSKKKRCGGLMLGLVLALGILPVLGAGPVPTPTTEESRAGVYEGRIGKDTLRYNEYALLIAGLSGGSGTLAAEEAKPAFLSHARVMNQTWANFERRQLSVMRTWVSRELSQTPQTTVFYPFSGPDFVSMYTMFPQARTYLMLSLEQVGEIPDVAALNSGTFYSRLQRSLYDLLHLSFFITPKLASSLGKTELKGVLPVLLFFLAREGLTVDDVKYWVMKPEGAIEEEAAATAPARCGAGDIPGLRIIFTKPGSAQSQTLYYFRFNLINDSFAKNRQFVEFLEKFGPLTTFSKAASYLMHRPNFSAIRQFILDRSSAFLQSDAAIPVQYFDPAAWNLRFYGCYKGPIALFRNRYQRDLAEIYQRGQEIQPLPFGICYRHRPRTSNLMFAAKKATMAQGPSD
jgi:hypothetical protein